MYKSTNGGGTWSAVNAGLTGYGGYEKYVWAFAVDPHTSTTLYAGTDRGVFKSTDGAGTWSAVNNGIRPDYPPSAGPCSVEAIAIDPLTPTTLYAGTGCSTGSGVFKSTDGGGHWSAVNTGVTAWYTVNAIAIDPQTPTTLYRGTTSGVFKSTNGGQTWSNFSTGLTTLDVNTLAIDLHTPTTLYAGTTMLVTTGGGVFGVQQSTTLAAAVLPGSRSVQVSGVASAFATIINTGTGTAVGCGIAPSPSVAGSTFSYQTTDPSTNVPNGTPDTPVNIPGSRLQTFVMAFVPSVPIAPLDVHLNFQCSNSSAAPVVIGLNTLLLSSSSGPVPDIVALAATLNNDGIANIPGAHGTGIFAVATVNVGAGARITATADTGAGSPPVTIALCQTDPGQGFCLQPPGSSVTTQIDGGQTPTFGVFITGTGTVPFDPATNRIFVRFKDGAGVTRGATSVAVRTQ